MRALFLFFLPYLYFAIVPPLAGYAEDGELFGYRLGGQYKPDQPLADHIDDAYVSLSLTESAKNLGLDSLEAVVLAKGFRAHKLIGTKQFKDWDKAKLYASKLGQLFLNDYGGDYWETLNLEQEPKNDGYPKHIPRVTIVYEQKFDGKYELVVKLFHGDRIFSKELSDPFIEVRYQDLRIDIGDHVYLGSGDE